MRTMRFWVAFLCLFTLLAGAVPNVDQMSSPSRCPVCEVEHCPRTPQECSHGVVRDNCGCCKEGVCLLMEKEKCLDVTLVKSIAETDMKKLSRCGDNMECRIRTDLKAGEIEESVCFCEKEEVSCGKDNTTYSSICQLQASGAELKHFGPCMSPPSILTDPESVPTSEHERFSLSCEARGFPVPDVHWEFEGLSGVFRTLPGDDSSLAVHSRGGPEPFTVTSWLMIEALRQADAGTYICVAKNSQGVARSGVSVNVARKNS